MNQYFSEIQELKILTQKLTSGQTLLADEISQLVDAEKDVVLLLYSRRSLEIIVRDISHSESIKISQTIPLKGMIDKLNKEQKVPPNIATAMLNLNSISTYGAHPKEFDSRQVKTVLINLVTILDWYIKYSGLDPVSDKENKESTGEKISSEPLHNRKAGSKKLKYALGSLIIIALIIATYFGFDFIKSINSNVDKSHFEKSIAVLPFRNLSNDESQAYFCDGFMEEVLNHLQRIKNFSVRSRTSSSFYRDSKKSLPEIAEELNVNYIIEGSVARQDNKLKIWVQLINAKLDEHIWSEDYNSEIKEIFTIQSDIAKQIAQNLETVLTKEEVTQIEKIPTENLEAYDYYLLGRASRMKKNEKDIHKAINLLEKAIELDPSLVKAYTELSNCYTNLPNYSTIRPKDAYEPAKKYALQAYELDSLSNAVVNLGVIKYEYEFDFGGAENYYKKGIRLNPGNADAYYQYADFLYQTGRATEALKMDSVALRIDPLNPSYQALFGFRLAYAGKFDAAFVHLKQLSAKLKDLGFINWILGGVYYLDGDFKNAIDEMEKGMKLSGEPPLWKSMLGLIYSKAGNERKLKECLNSLEQKSQGTYIPYSLRAMLYAELGDDKTALKYLKIAYEERELFLIYFRYVIKDAFLNLRYHPEYIEIMKKIWKDY